MDLTDWNEVLSSESCDMCIGKFYARLNSIISEKVPVKTIFSDDFPYSFSKEL